MSTDSDTGGPIERATRAYVRGLKDPPAHTLALAEAAYILARHLDLDTAPAPATAREWRGTLDAIAAAGLEVEVSRVDELAARRAAHVAKAAPGT
jgi:hypothetical protein